MIIAPEAYERMPILVNPLLIPDMSASAGRSHSRAVERVVEFHRLDLDSRLKLLPEHKYQKINRTVRSEDHRRDARMTNLDLIAGTAASSESIVILAASNQVLPHLSQATAAYEKPGALPIEHAASLSV
ncbi:MAG: hypothetical protein HQ503_18275 [Rhodospirillales bacterium]|nr:hypothetical protein [Rhodospirillales bacterium]